MYFIDFYIKKCKLPLNKRPVLNALTIWRVSLPAVVRQSNFATNNSFATRGNQWFWKICILTLKSKVSHFTSHKLNGAFVLDLNQIIAQNKNSWRLGTINTILQNTLRAVNKSKSFIIRLLICKLPFILW